MTPSGAHDSGRWSALLTALGFVVLLLPCIARAGIEAPPELRGDPAGSAFAARRAQLLDQMNALQADIAALDAQCSHVAEDDTALVSSCRDRQQSVLAELSAYQAALAAYKADLATATAAAQATRPAEKRGYTPAGNAFIGGTSWIVGYDVSPDMSPALKAAAAEMLKKQTELAGIPYNAAIDFTRYNFVLGIAASTDIFTDLRKRVIFDELSNGKATPAMQNAYDSLKGRSFDELACHSNGAMICLAALSNQDIMADRVVLYGPQITAESLQMWQQLIRDHKIKSVQIYINQNDPVPPVSMLMSSPATLITGTALMAMPLFKADVMKEAIHVLTPDIGVKTYGCGGSLPTLECHDARVYKFDRGCKPQPSSGKTVPGTALPGGRGALEPPPPC